MEGGKTSETMNNGRQKREGEKWIGEGNLEVNSRYSKAGGCHISFGLGLPRAAG